MIFIRPIWTVQTAHECVSLAFHPAGSALAAGSTEGHLIVLNTEAAGATVASVRVCGSPLNALGYNQGIRNNINRIKGCTANVRF